jgi:hypothetical protein
MFDNRMLRGIFGSKKKELTLTGGPRKMRNEEVHNLCSSLNMIRMKLVEYVHTWKK